jgi:hypothetical protein
LLLSYRRTRVWVKLLRQVDGPEPVWDVNPIFEIGGQPHVKVTQAIASVPAKAIRLLSSRQPTAVMR